MSIPLKVCRNLRICVKTYERGSEPYNVCQNMRKCVKPVKMLLGEQKYAFCSTLHAATQYSFLAQYKSLLPVFKGVCVCVCRSHSMGSLLLSKKIPNLGNSIQFTRLLNQSLIYVVCNIIFVQADNIMLTMSVFCVLLILSLTILS